MKRRQFTAKFKFQVALEALQGQQTINEVASHHEVGCLLGATQVKQWKKQLQEQGADVFNEKVTKRNVSKPRRKRRYMNK